VLKYELKKGRRFEMRKVRVVGIKRLIDLETGEEITATVEAVEPERKFGWEAVWLGMLLDTLDVITNKGFKVAKYLLSKRIRSENLVVATAKKIAKETGVSESTVKRVMKHLIAANFIVQVQKGVYRVNPAIIWRGSESKRQAILIVFEKEKKGKGKEEETLKNTITEVRYE
jgi:DNA-binding transcriptional regulator YhcF (GntR family)